MHRPLTYLRKYSTEVEHIKFYGIFERQKCVDDLRQAAGNAR